MAIKYACDGCDYVTDDPERLESFRRVMLREKFYCTTCMEVANEFSVEILRVRQQQVKRLQEATDKVRQKYLKQLRSLPNV